MLSFPLYDQLLERSQLIDFKDSSWNSISMSINQMPSEQLEIIYAVILHYANMNGASAITNKAPYKGKTTSKRKGIKYNMNDFPEDLKKIIGMYVMSSGDRTI